MDVVFFIGDDNFQNELLTIFKRRIQRIFMLILVINQPTSILKYSNKIITLFLIQPNSC
jgi:glutathione synthase/RimK-type ligase-like ATP-grasp enzyme